MILKFKCWATQRGLPSDLPNVEIESAGGFIGMASRLAAERFALELYFDDGREWDGILVSTVHIREDGTGGSERHWRAKIIDEPRAVAEEQK